MKNIPSIGIFDSGVGGLSVLERLQHVLPNERLIYVADSKYAPYGQMTSSDIKTRAFIITDFLTQHHNIKLLVVACNTATAACIHELREKYCLPIVGMEPAVKPAISASKKKKIGILATEGTLKSAKFIALLENYDGEAIFYVQPCAGLVELIEKGEIHSDLIKRLIYSYLLPLKNNKVDVIVLGCTHYVFIKKIVEDYFSGMVSVIDTGLAVALHVERILKEKNLASLESSPSSPLVYSNGNDINGSIELLVPNMKNNFIFSRSFTSL